MHKIQSDSNRVALYGYLNKEAGWREVVQQIIQSLQSGKGFGGMPLDKLLAGGGALAGGGLGALLAPQSRGLGAMGGALLGGGLGYLGGRYGAKPAGDWLASQEALKPAAASPAEPEKPVSL